MKRTVVTVIVGLLIAGAVLFLTRPWSDYGPLAMNALFHPDKRVENFRHMDRVFPARTITAAPAVFEFPRAERPLDLTYRFAGKSRTLDDFLERASVTGLLVIKDGEIIHERYRLGAGADSRFTSWSMAKSYVSTLVGMALAEGRIDSLDHPISDYVPALRETAYDGIPIRHVLQMSSGVDFDETYSDHFSDVRQFFWKIYVFGQRADDVITGYGRERPPGQVFQYASIDTQALGMLLREIHGRSLTALLEERLWHPLGADEAFWNVDAESEDATPVAFCCLNARLRDFAKLGQLYLQQGRWQGEQLLPPDWVTEATRPGAPHLEPGVSPYDYGPRGYQYQWWVPEDYDREYFAAGHYGQYVYVSEPDNLVIARTAVDPDYRDHATENITVFRAIRDALRAESTSD
jgi:CubicO group peptidase (beta-lactamase class C family)